MFTKRNAETIRKEYENNGERGGALTRVREYARIARGMGLNDYDLYDALEYIFDKIEDVYTGSISRAIYNAAFNHPLFAIGYQCADGSYSMLRGVYDTEADADAARISKQPNYKHKLEVKAI